MFEKITNCELQMMDIEITTLDIFVQKHSIQHIDYLKIDTEGYEINVLKGAET
jgi:FkbM family methyltransferase